ncbi:MAG: divalent-cation tolerance protein CutA [Microthrixaceae bacterium]
MQEPEHGVGDDEGVGEEIVVLVTVPSVDVAQLLADSLVDERLAACVKRTGPVMSTYRWAGAVEHAEEWRLEIVTVAGRFDALVARVGELHPYEVPEVIGIAVSAGGESYLRWVRGESGGPV